MSERLWEKLIGHANSRDALLKRVEQDRVSGAYLVVGPRGVGKSLFAQALAQSLLCEIEIAACGSCPSCLRTAKKQHEALLWVKPEKNQIRLEEALQIQDFLATKSAHKKRVVLVDDIQQFNAQAANALLKVIEEPPPNTSFVFTAISERATLTTIRSRCQLVRLAPLSNDEIKERMATAQDWQMQAAMGLVGRLHRLSETGEEQHLKRAEKLWQDFFQGGGEVPADIVGLPRELSMDLAEWWLSFARDLVFLASEGAHGHQLLQFPQFVSPPKAAKLSLMQRLHLFFYVEELSRALQSTRDQRLVWEQAWIRMQRVLTSEVNEREMDRYSLTF